MGQVTEVNFVLPWSEVRKSSLKGHFTGEDMRLMSK